MTNMIERVARAIYGEVFDACHDSVRHLMIAKARDAIKAMCNPTDEMIAAGLTTGCRFGPSAMGKIFTVMIDAALTPKIEE